MQTIKKELDFTNLNSNAFGYYIIYIAQIKVFPRDSIPPERQLAGSHAATIQVLVTAMSCGFKSLHPHQETGSMGTLGPFSFVHLH